MNASEACQTTVLTGGNQRAMNSENMSHILARKFVNIPHFSVYWFIVYSLT